MTGLLIAGCQGNSDPNESPSSDAGNQSVDAKQASFDATPNDNPDASSVVGEVQFRLGISNDIPESIYVQLNNEDGQPAWVTVRKDEERVYLLARCEYPDCDMPSGVCGAAQPRVRDITAGGFTGEIEFLWDGKVSVIEPDLECERRRVPATEGAYIASFCFGFQADIEGPGDPTAEQGVPGTVLNPYCQDVPFTLPTDKVEWELLGG
jgi:hypothetical protein